MLLLATFPISQSHATEAGAQHRPSTITPNCGRRYMELFISRLSLRTQKPVLTTQRRLGALRFKHLAAINHSFHTVFGLWGLSHTPCWVM